MKRRAGILALAALILMLSACSYRSAQGGVSAAPSPSPGRIYLCGEAHGVEKILDKEFELWHGYYHNKGMRHLFVEFPYYTAEFLNIWMQADGDDILEALYNDWDGTAGHTPSMMELFRKIKSECPETIFHGTDVGHQYHSTGGRFLKHLEDNGLKGSAQYILAQEAIAQGKYYYAHADDAYRENKMTENFIREYDGLNGADIMGIYGGAHTGLDAMDFTGSVPCMANQLKGRHGDAVQSEDLTGLAKVTEPYRVDVMKVNGAEYEASYFGKEELPWHKEYAFREFWRLENAYGDFNDCPKTGDVLPYGNYPTPVETGQVFVIDYTKTDGSVVRMFHRSDGAIWDGTPSTEEFRIN
ncbi:MAG TPA: hypothetical protein VN366_08760 [Feifaniaceae bacterium]|nr:hypothetical protein [Feifaniaceae bacterium]